MRHLVENNHATGPQVATAAMQEFGLPLVDFDTLGRKFQPVSLIDNKLIEKHRAVPLHKRGNRLYLAIADPTNMVTLDEFNFATGLTAKSVLVEDDKLTCRIDQILSAEEMGSAAEDLDDDLGNVDVKGDADEEGESGDVTRSDADDTPVVRYINNILLDAINRGASDVHIEPYEKYMRIRYRIDGILLDVAKPPLAMSHRLIARVKVMSRMDIPERRLPQDGRIKMKISRHRAIDFRVNTCPTLFGEKVVLRILDPGSAQMRIEKLGYEPDQEKLYTDALSKPYGMVLVTGPTGSGKTVSLYTGLNILNTADRNISTAEDPAEINLAGINQVNVNNKVGLTFAEALRSFLRQDPDVTMVGEIRDLETAEIAIKAAQTGHMVLSTLHTNDAPQTLTRMINMGVPPFNVVTAVSLIVAQRLGRRLCEQCKILDDIPREVLIEEGFTDDEVDVLRVYTAVGCSQCNEKGYKATSGPTRSCRSRTPLAGS